MRKLIIISFLLNLFVFNGISQNNALKGSFMYWIGDESDASSSSIAYERNIAKHFSYNIGYSYLDGDHSQGYYLRNSFRYYISKKKKNFFNQMYLYSGFDFCHDDAAQHYHNNGDTTLAYYSNSYIITTGIGRKVYVLKRLFFEINLEAHYYKTVYSSTYSCNYTGKWEWEIYPFPRIFVGFSF